MVWRQWSLYTSLGFLCDGFTWLRGAGELCSYGVPKRKALWTGSKRPVYLQESGVEGSNPSSCTARIVQWIEHWKVTVESYNGLATPTDLINQAKNVTTPKCPAEDSCKLPE